MKGTRNLLVGLLLGSALILLAWFISYLPIEPRKQQAKSPYPTYLPPR